MKSKHPLGLFCSESTNGSPAFVAIHIREQGSTPAVAQEKGNQTASFDMNTNATRQAEDTPISPPTTTTSRLQGTYPPSATRLGFRKSLQEGGYITMWSHKANPKCSFTPTHRRGWGGQLGLQWLWRNNPILLTNSSTFWRHGSVDVLLGYHASGKRGFTPKAKHRNGRDMVSQASYVLQLLNEITLQSKNQLLPE